MKALVTRFYLLAFLLLALAGRAAAQSDPLGAVRGAFASGSSRELAQYLAPTVEVGFDGDSHSYNATQTELVVRNFFTKNPPAGFEVVHQGASNDGIPYAMCRYTGRNGTYQVFIRLKPRQSSPVIDTIDFTKQ